MAACDGARRGAGCKEAVYAGGAHCMVAFGVDEEGEAGVEVAVGFTNGADVGGWIGGIVA